MTTTTAGPCSAKDWPAKDEGPPARLGFSSLPPPWIMKSTGSAFRWGGEKTLRFKQTSLPTAVTPPRGTCGHQFPNFVTLFTPVHGTTGAGARQRWAPAGEAA